MAFWNKDIETLPRDKLEELQVKRLKDTVARCRKSTFYKTQLKDVDESRFTSSEDVSQIPFTTKNDLRINYDFGLVTVPREELVRMHSSSGTTGKATVIFHTRADIEKWSDLVARCITMTGAGKADVFQNIISYGMFTGGLGLHYGAEKVGMLTIPSGVGNTKRQIQLMNDFNTTVFHATPSYILYVAEVMVEEGFDPKEFDLRIGFVGAEPHSERTRQRIEEIYDINAFNSYGMSELNGPGVAFECEEKSGMHLWEDSYLLEVVDPDTGEKLGPGEEGELVISTIDRVAMPILRYRTGDLAMIIDDGERCTCGRTHARISRIKGRCDDMLIVKGVNLYPSQIEDVLMSFPEIATSYQIILERDGTLDSLTVRVELYPKMFDGDLRKLKKLEADITKSVQDEIVVRPKIEFHEPGSLPRSEGKAVRVVDMRGEI
ncbi:MAG TPA: phenylacetate--CoA ligase family protein [Methanophagales archaeon]|nr:phenylacetate--CoA ligase family protein [Methanophagales archaeon]